MSTFIAFIATVIAGAQLWAAYEANQQSRRSREADDKRYAFASCEPLVTSEVHAILAKPSPTEQEISFVKAQFELCQLKATSMLSNRVEGDPSISTPINDSFEPVKTFLHRVGESADTTALDKKLGQNDHSKYSWDGEGSYSKIRTINRIAQRWAGEQKLTTRGAFEESFGAELRAAVPARADEFQTTYLLTTDSEKNTLDGLLLVLDGEPCGVHWRCGFKNTRLGVEVHKPIIDYFAKVHKYPAVGL